MKILITGATGLVGQHLGLSLARQGHELVVLTRNPIRALQESWFPCEAFEWDAEKSLPPEIAFNGIEAVVHLAGTPIADKKWNADVKKSLVDSRIRGTHFLVQRIKTLKDKPKVFIGASAVGIYGDRGDESLNESSALGTGFLADLCKGWEESSKELLDLGVRRVLLRLGLVIASQGGALEKMVPIAQAGMLGDIGTGKGMMSWIHINDLVSMIEWAVNGKIEGIYNAVAPVPCTNKAFTSALVKELGTKKFIPVPPLALKLLYGEMSQVLLASQKVFPIKALDQNFKFEFRDIAQAVDGLFPAHSSGQSWFIFNQYIPKPKNEVFDFFKSEKNLEVITPEFLKFKVLEKSPGPIREGTIIKYSLNVHGLPMNWTTLIREFKENEFFVDTQESGPYESWHHTHTFEELGEGTLVKDVVVYGLPFGVLGRVGGSALVRRDVTSIFDYRAKNIAALLGGTQSKKEIK